MIWIKARNSYTMGHRLNPGLLYFNATLDFVSMRQNLAYLQNIYQENSPNRISLMNCGKLLAESAVAHKKELCFSQSVAKSYQPAE